VTDIIDPELDNLWLSFAKLIRRGLDLRRRFRARGIHVDALEQWTAAGMGVPADRKTILDWFDDRPDSSHQRMLERRMEVAAARVQYRKRWGLEAKT